MKHPSLILLLLFSATCWSADFQKGIDAYMRGDYATALKEMTPLAEQGNASSQDYLGLMYDFGKGVPLDHQTAVKWYRLAAEQGNARGQYHLGMSYRGGYGVIKDYKTAMKWLTLAAEQGDNHAQGNLGMMYSQGEGVPQDLIRAHMWFNLANSKGTDLTWGEIRDITTQQLTFSQLREAQELARECVKKNYTGC